MSRPNILIIMADQFNGTLFADGPAAFLHAPNLRALAERSVRFANTYTALPLCAPARASFMSGQLPSRTGVYDNAAEFRSDIPTYAHHLRRAGYETALSGKMHFVGPDQMHGFEERLTTDIYPADFGWTPDYRKPGERIDWWYHNLGSVTGAGVAEITNQMEYDDEVAFHANQKLYQYSRASTDAKRRPWCLTVSFTHPHDPYVARRRFWDMYEGIPELDPAVDEIPYEDQDPHSKRLIDACDTAKFDITRDNVRRARQGYFANISYIDDKVGELLETLRATRMLDDTIILFTSDHGDMLGERGLWYKMHWFEGAARVPMVVHAPGRYAPGRVAASVSTIDLLPTFVEMAGGTLDAGLPLDGRSLLPHLTGTGGHDEAIGEYMAEGTTTPLVMIRRGRYKFIFSTQDPCLLFDLQADPDELHNLAIVPEHRALMASLLEEAGQRWDMPALHAQVLASQRRRRFVYGALTQGRLTSWDHQPMVDASQQYMRNHIDLDDLERRARFPRP